MICQHELLNQAARLIDQAGCGPRWANTTARSTPPPAARARLHRKRPRPAGGAGRLLTARDGRRAAASGLLATGISYYNAETVKTAFARCPMAAAHRPENSPARPHARPGPGTQPLGHGRLDSTVASFRPAARLAGRAGGRHHVRPDPDTIQFRSVRRACGMRVCASVLAALLVAALLEALYALFRRYRGGQAPALNGTNRQHTPRARVAPGARLGIVDLGFQLGDQPGEPAVLAAGIDHRRRRLAGAPVRLVRVHPGRQALVRASRPDSQDQA